MWTSAINNPSWNPEGGALYSDPTQICSILFKDYDVWEFVSIQSSLKKTHKVGNVGIIANLVCPYIYCFLIYLTIMMLVNVKLIWKDTRELRFKVTYSIGLLHFSWHRQNHLTLLAFIHVLGGDCKKTLLGSMQRRVPVEWCKYDKGGGCPIMFVLLWKEGDQWVGSVQMINHYLILIKSRLRRNLLSFLCINRR